MASLFRRDKPIRPEFLVPPAEAGVTQRFAELQSRHDAALRLIDGLCGTAATDVRDALLEVRLVLHPAEPVASGRAEVSIDSCQENPW